MYVIGVSLQVQVIQQINHDGEVYWARCIPQDLCIVAARTNNEEAYVFVCRKHPSRPRLDGPCNPDLRLKGHTAEGYGLSWSQFMPGHLLSASNDAQICLQDINATPENKALDARHIFKVNSLAFNPINECLVATGSANKTVKLLDILKISTALYTFCHKREVLQVGWHPKNEAVLASSCFGRRMMVWILAGNFIRLIEGIRLISRKDDDDDVSFNSILLHRIGKEQTPEEAKEGPFFIHGGHESETSNFSWNPCEDWAIASVAHDNVFHI